MRRMQWLIILCGLASSLVKAQMPTVYVGLDQGLMEYQGTLGQSKIGLTLVIDKASAPHGSYFYFKHLKDIPLDGRFIEDGFVLDEHDASRKVNGAFHLTLSTEGARHIKGPLTLSNTMVLTGLWHSADGQRELPVRLVQVTWTDGSEDHRYGPFGNNAEVERKVQGLLSAIERGDKQAASTFVSYPLRVTDRNLVIRNAQQFLEEYDRIFTPDRVRCLEQFPAHNMFMNYQGIMFGNGGELWFDGKGLITVNSCMIAPD
jgi:hypothetical protein